jgi:hypothetical protein
MPPTHRIYVESGKQRVFAAALDWPGWCRAGRDQEVAVEALLASAPRYRAAVARARKGFAVPKDASALRIVERLKGNASTDFGVPALSPKSDDRPLGDAELARLSALLKACWRTFDGIAQGASGAILRTGPRGGGRDLNAIVDHVLDAEQAYLSRLRGKLPPKGEGDIGDRMMAVRQAVLAAVSARAHGEPLPPSRQTAKVWAPRYAVRRSAWHALDHAWEIEDRAEDPPSPRRRR